MTENLTSKLEKLFNQDSYFIPKNFAYIWVEYKAINCGNYIGSFKMVNRQKLSEYIYTIISVDDGIGVRIENYIDEQWPKICKPLDLSKFIE
ncbi:hypothetical protein [Alishewanella phage vB_AspM_Slickus01]|nr:hypothetical protein [Alishewanella phage vB_AspM_Slickus01]